MYDEIKRRIEQRLSKVPHFNIERIIIGGEDSERDKSLISRHVTSELERHMSEMNADIDASEAAGQPRDAVPEFSGLRSRRQLIEHFVERLSVDIGSSMKAFDFTVRSGSRVLGPPYDVDWEEGNAFGAGIWGAVTTGR